MEVLEYHGRQYRPLLRTDFRYSVRVGSLVRVRENRFQNFHQNRTNEPARSRPT